MIKVKVKCSRKTKTWFKKYNIDTLKLEHIVENILLKDFPRKNRFLHFSIKVDKKCLDSGYYFGSDTLEIGVAPWRKRYDKMSRRRIFLRDFLHELRHWIQDRIMNIKEWELDYTAEDVAYKTPRYYKNKWEIDARKFASKHFHKTFKTLFNK